MQNLRHEIMANFRRTDQTVKEWAAQRGFSLSTVAAAIHGKRGVANCSRGPRPEKTAEIRAALIADGLWPSEEEHTLSSSGHHRN